MAGKDIAVKKYVVRLSALVQDNMRPYGGLAVCRLSRAGSAPSRQAVRVALHAQTWKLARHRRVRTRRPVEPMSEPPHSRQADSRKRSRRLAGPSQQASRKADWQFTTNDARAKLKRLYPSF